MWQPQVGAGVGVCKTTTSKFFVPPVKPYWHHCETTSLTPLSPGYFGYAVTIFRRPRAILLHFPLFVHSFPHSLYKPNPGWSGGFNQLLMRLKKPDSSTVSYFSVFLCKEQHFPRQTNLIMKLRIFRPLVATTINDGSQYMDSGVLKIFITTLHWMIVLICLRHISGAFIIWCNEYWGQATWAPPVFNVTL